ncbi:prefoldin subunit 1 isoform X1 [Monomorium pharaonis]|uniref:prefoldin subunit 1 isoform X1 n=2 Tax=Monomorium pharaonis TaxID=307658 RepID=UPI00063F679A|nr:prefoldin subunit 1 isoform X1 [Monomorium pharaonis]
MVRKDQKRLYVNKVYFTTVLQKNSRMSKVLDEELKQAFSKLHEKMVDTKQKLKLADIQIGKLRGTKQRTELTMKEIGTLPNDTRMYESVGRMFLLNKMNNVKDNLETRIKTSDEKIKTLENNKAYLQRSLKESENEIREMIQQKQSKETSG